MTVAEVIRRLRRHKPLCLQDLMADCGFTLTFLGEGAFRETYHIAGTELVVKVPIQYDRYEQERIESYEQNQNRFHAISEYQTWSRLKKSKRKYTALQPYLPEIHYFSYASGMLLMQQYQTVEEDDERVDWDKFEEIHKLVCTLVAKNDPDIGGCTNIALDAKGGIRFIDMGCFAGDH